MGCPLGIRAIAIAAGSVVLVVGGISVLALVNSNERETNDVYVPSPTTVRGAFMSALGTYPEIINLQTSFVTIQGDNRFKSWSLRGSFKRENRNIPIFASITHICDAKSDDPDCWRLGELSVDGRNIPTGTPMVSSITENTTPSGEAGKAKGDDAGKTTQSSKSDLVPRSAHETTDTPSLVPPATTKNAAVPIETKTASAQGGDNTIWRTKSDKANARVAPSLDAEIAFTMPSDIPLTLIEERNSWGHFEYPAANKQRGSVWIHMDVVERARN